MLAFAGNSLLCRVALRDTAIDAASFTSIRLASGALMLAADRARAGRPADRRREAGRPPPACSAMPPASLSPIASSRPRPARCCCSARCRPRCCPGASSSASGCGALQIVGLLVAVGGLVYMLLPGLAAPPLVGAAFMIAAGISWSGYSMLGRGTTDPLDATAGNFLRARAVRRGAEPRPSHAPARRSTIPARSTPSISGAITSGLGYVLWYAALPVAHGHVGRGDPAQRAGDRGAGRRGAAGRAAVEPPGDRIRHDPGRYRADDLASPHLTGG